MEEPELLQEVCENYFEPSGFGYTVKYKAFSHWCDFECFEVVALADGDIPEYEQLGGGYGALEGAVAIIDGGVKWDGCINYSFTDDVCLHACSAEDMKKPFKVMEKIYSRCAELIPTFDKADVR